MVTVPLPAPRLRAVPDVVVIEEAESMVAAFTVPAMPVWVPLETVVPEPHRLRRA